MSSSHVQISHIISHVSKNWDTIIDSFKQITFIKFLKTSEKNNMVSIVSTPTSTRFKNKRCTIMLMIIKKYPNHVFMKFSDSEEGITRIIHTAKSVVIDKTTICLTENPIGDDRYEYFFDDDILKKPYVKIDWDTGDVIDRMFL